MEPNAERWRLYVRNNKAEMEKFARRLIRAVARMLLQEKRNEDEVWEGLNKETGMDCKELWARMQALTIRKLERLLNAEDRVDRLPKEARMSITDWLLFDTVLVHQNFDVIGVTETSKEDRKVLVDLFDLVEKFKLEFLAGDQLADAWSEATIYYNKDNRECTPMLLQRRWYQLKLATRVRFYNFWSMYKGVVKKLNQAEAYKPTPLQTNIAKRYKPLVVTAFLSWEELIKNKLVILPEEFEIKSQKQMIVDNVPDVMCLEPDVETIDLDNDSDIDFEYRKVPENEDSEPINIKQEPREEDDMDIDESMPYENRQDKIANFAEAVLKETTMELEKLDLIEDSDISVTYKSSGIISTENSTEIHFVDDINKDLSSVASSSHVENTTLGTSKESLASVIYNPTIEHDLEIMPVTKDPEVIPLETGAPTNNEIVQTDLMIGDDVEIVKLIKKEPEPILPQITSIFGGVNDSNESLSKISLLAAQITNTVKDTIIQKASISNKGLNRPDMGLSGDSVQDFPMSNAENKILAPEDNNSVAQNLDAETGIKSKSWFGELSNDIDFVDDGIQLIDDGIVYQEEDDYSYEVGGHKVKTEIDIEKEEVKIANTEEVQDWEGNKFDEKLLMVPVVYTVKLDDMGILPLHLLNYVNNKENLDAISSKSKVARKEMEANTELVKDSKKGLREVKLSSYLLKKPRHRTYNPIQLCKNPDFNTRLKRLNVGFFSSSQNRLLLKACQPVTIDVSKAFEDRLVNGTMYLKISDVIDSHKKIDFKEKRENFSILPSAMPAQSLIDNPEGEIAPVITHDSNTKPVEMNSLAPERNRVINLPNISEIRRINQKLLTAQVTPLQFKNDNSQISTAIIPTSVNNSVNNSKAAPASRKISTTEANNASNLILNVESQNLSMPRGKELYKTGYRAIPWKSREIRPEVPWINSSSGLYSPDTLLALDTLNKMLCLLTDGEKDLAVYDIKPMKKKLKSGLHENATTSISDKKTKKSDDADDVQFIGETQFNSTNANNCCKEKKNVTKTGKRSKRLYCCWARERISQMIYSKKRKSKHKCPFPLCLCCCKYPLLEHYKKAREMSTDKKELQGWESFLNFDTNADKVHNVVTEKGNISADVAELIPIQITPECVPNNEKGPTDSHIQKGRNVDIISCSAISPAHAVTVSDRSTQSELENDSGDPHTLGTEISIISCETRSSTIGVDTLKSKTPVTNEVLTTKDPHISVKSTDDTSYTCTQYKDGADQLEMIGITKSIQNEAGSSALETEDGNISSLTSRVLTIDATNTNVETISTPSRKLSIHIKSADGPTYGRLRCNQYGYNANRRPRITLLPSQQIKVTSEKNTKKLDVTHPFVNVEKKGKPNQHNVKVCNDFTPALAVKPMNNIMFNSNIDQDNNPNQKMIYLNSKHLSELPSDNPIYLGKNKILLTTLKFPQNFKAFEAYQQNLKKTMALPKGITLILGLDGHLTYTRDLKAEISDEFLKAMPHLVDAIQQQIDTISGLVPSLKTLSNDEIILLSDEEPCDYEKIDKKEGLSNQATMNKLSEEEHNGSDNSIVENSMELSHLEIQTNDSEVNSKNTLKIGNSSTHIETNTVSNKQSITTSKFEGTILDELIKDNVTKSLDTPRKNIEVNDDELTDNNNRDTEHVPLERKELSTEMLHENKNVNNNIKTKNILSDLMAMSGILPTEEPSSDVTSSEISNQPFIQNSKLSTHPTIDLAGIQSLQQCSTNTSLNNSSLHSPKSSPSKGSETSALSGISQILTTITSLSELKYACSHKASFFKLDLITRFLIPINVCMKSLHKTSPPKHTELNKPKLISSGATIDLTDDDVSEVSMNNQQNSLSGIKQTLSINSGDDNTNNKDTTDNTSNKDSPISVHRHKIVKPLKLFSSRSFNLQHRLKSILKRIKHTKKMENIVLRRRQRKQVFLTNPERVEECMEVQDSSSDEEPLANIATKKRQIEKDKESTSEKMDVSKDEENKASDVSLDDREVTCDLPTAATDAEYLDEELLEEEESDEACILGV